MAYSIAKISITMMSMSFARYSCLMIAPRCLSTSRDPCTNAVDYLSWTPHNYDATISNKGEAIGNLLKQKRTEEYRDITGVFRLQVKDLPKFIPPFETE
jgi:hypothetical protein